MATGIPTVSSPAVVRSADDTDRYIQSQICRTATRVKIIELISAAILWGIGLLAVLVALAVIDHWILPLHFWTRLLALVGIVAGSAGYLVSTIGPLLVRRINPVFAARVIEAGEPSLKNSLINFLLLRSRREAVREVVFDAIQQRAASDLARVPVDLTVDRARAIRLGYVLVGTIAVAALYGMLSPKNTLQTWSRVAAPWADIARPARVRIDDIEPGNAQLFQGEHVKVRARVAGAKSAMVHWTTADGQSASQSVPMTSDGTGYFECQLPPSADGVQSSLVYHLESGDAISNTFRIEMKLLPMILVDRIEYEFPEYTRLPPQVVEHEGDVRALEGTRVTIHGRANQPIAQAAIELESATTTDTRPSRDGRTLRMEASEDRAAVSLRLGLADDGSTPVYSRYRLSLITADGRRSQRPVEHRIEVLRDIPPAIEILTPTRRSIEVPLNGKQRFEVRAIDPDFGLRQITWHVRKGNRELLVRDDANGRWPGEILLLEPAGQTGQVTRDALLVPAKLGLAEGDLVEVWAAADDNRVTYKNDQPVLEPNRQRTPTYSVKITAARRGEASDHQRDSDDSQSGDNARSPDPRREKNDERPRHDQADNSSAKEPKEEAKDGSQDDPRNADHSDARPPDAGPSERQKKDDRRQKDDQRKDGQQKDGQQKDGQQKDGQQKDGQQKDGRSKKDDQQDNTGGQKNGEQKGGASGGKGKQQDGQQKNQQGDNRQGGAPSDSSESREPGEPSAGSGERGDSRGGSSDDSSDGSSQDAAGGENRSGAGNERQGAGSQSSANADRGAGSGGEDSRRADHDGEAFERLIRHFESQQGDDSGQSRGQGQNVESSKTDTSPQSPNGRPQSGGSDGESGQTASDDQRGSSTAKNDQAGTGGSPNKGEGKPDQASPDKKSDEARGQASEKHDPGHGDDGQSGAGNPSEDKSGAPEQAGKNRDRPKTDDGGAKKKTPAEPTPQANSTRQSNSRGQGNSDRSGGGDKGGGQGGNQAGNDSSGSNSAADEGNGQSSEAGDGETGPKAGDSQTAADKTGRSGQQRGSGSQSRGGSGTNPGSGSRDGSRAMPKSSPDMNSQEQKSPDKNPSDSQPDARSGRPPGDSPDARDASRTGQQPGGNSASTGGGVVGDGVPTEAAAAAQGGEAPPGDDVNLEYARRATNLVLDKLQEQKDDPDKKLLDKLGWTQEELAAFLERWQKLRREAADNKMDSKDELREEVRSLGLRPRGTRLKRGGTDSDAVRGLRDAGERSAPPPGHLDKYNSYKKSVTRGGGRD